MKGLVKCHLGFFVKCYRIDHSGILYIRLNTKGIDLDRIVSMTSRFTPADIEYLFQQVAQFAFDEEYASKHDYTGTTDTFLHMIPTIRPSLTEEMIANFQKDSIAYART